VNIRLATAEDAPALARLRYDFRAAEHPPVEAEAEFVARCAAWMAARLQPPTPWRCWLLEGDAGAIAGNLWLQIIEKLPNPGPEPESHAYITNVYVAPSARGHGAGELLVSTALAFCRDNGVDSAILWPTARSRNLYARHGFAVRDDLLEAVITPGRE